MIYKSLLICLLVLAGCSQNNKEQAASDLAKVKLKDLKNQSIDLNAYRGKTVFLNVWATWCKPCLQEMPSIENAQAQLRNENIVFLLASNEEVDQIETFIKKRSYPFQFVHLENMEDLNIQALPTTYIFNAEGALKFSEMGARKWDDAVNLDLITSIISGHEK